jgi:LPXTG-motif cell wall-anchored protein
MAEVSTTSSAAPIVSPTDVVIAPEVVAIAANATAEKTEGLVVSPKTTEVVCNTGCVAALLASTGVADGEVSVVIGDAAPVALPLDNHVKINVGSKDSVMKFIVKSPKGVETVVSVPVTHSSSVAEPAGEPSDSNTNVYLIIAGVLVLLAGAGYVVRRKTV